MEMYSTAELLGVVETIAPQTSFWLPNFFPRALNFTTEEIFFDKVTKNRNLAPFVAPNVQGKPMMNRGFKTDSFKPAYVKPKDPITPSEMFHRMAGESLGGNMMSPAERWDAAIAARLADHRRAIERRWEWMACQAALFGAVTVAGEDYPSTTVDFGRKSSHTVTLAGTARWGQSTADIMGNIEAWALLIFNDTSFVVDKVTVTPDVWAIMRKDTAILALLETRRGSLSTAETGAIKPSLSRRVAILGEFEIWVYSDTYIDDAGASQKFMPSGTVFLGSEQGMEGVQAFGAILDNKARLAPVSIFSKMWDEEDPSVTFIMSQSAPLMIPGQPDATLLANVL